MGPVPASRKASRVKRLASGSVERHSTTNTGISNALDSSEQASVSVDLQQELLHTFIAAFPDLLDPNRLVVRLQPLLQRVKHFLYERDFQSAFGDPDLLRAYAVRWSASRALAYASIFHELDSHLQNLVAADKSHESIKVSCLGGGAGGELVGLAGLLAWRQRVPASTHQAAGMHVAAVDLADWSPILERLDTLLKDKFVAQSSNALTMSSTQADLLDLANFGDGAPLAVSVSNANLVTIFFTLNELYSTSMPRTQAMLFELTRLMQPGSLLLVVDSPGSYSTVALAKNSTKPGMSSAGNIPGQSAPRKYPMSWLLDHALLTLAANVDSSKMSPSPNSISPWEKLETVESRWFRLSSELRYPIPLEDMRYQLHLFRRQRV